MHGLHELPGKSKLIKAMNDLQKPARLDMKTIALYSQWARLEPRLAESFTLYLVEQWPHLEVGELIHQLKTQPWPRAILVPLRFVLLRLAKPEQKLLRGIISTVQTSVNGHPWQLFFIPLQNPIRSVIYDEVELATSPYTQTHFLGKQSLLTHSLFPKNQTVLSSERRKAILIGLLQSRSEFSVNDYIQACEGLLTPRQAQRDLKECKDLTARGFTRNRTYRRNAKK